MVSVVSNASSTILVPVTDLTRTTMLSSFSQPELTWTTSPARIPAAEIGAVFAHNDDMALGALHAVKQAGGNLAVRIFGIDGAPAFLDAIAAGEADMTAFQNAEKIGALGVETAVKLVRGKIVPDHIPVAWEAVDAGNVMEYIKRWDGKKGLFL